VHRRTERTETPGRTPPTRRVRVRDVVLVLALVGGWSLSAFGQDYAWGVLPGWWRPIDLVLGVVTVGALRWRKTHPVHVALVLGVAGGFVLSAMVPVLVSIWTVATLRPVRVTLAVAAAHLAVAVPYYVVFPIMPDGLLAWTVVLVLLYAVVVSSGVAVRSRRQVIVGLVESAERDRREYEARLETVRGAERARIAREMHDVLAHRLSLLSVHAGALEYRTRPGGPRPPDAELHDSAEVVRASAHRALEELAEVLTVLREDPDAPAADDALGTARPQPEISDLPRLVAEARTAGQRVRLHLPDDASPLAGLRRQVHRTVYRVVQEGLTNARKHAPGAEVDVRVEAEAGRRVHAVVRNPLPLGVAGDEVGAGAPIPGAGTGLAGLRERVRVDGGSLRTDVRDGAFSLEVELPWRT
jgi:signal transduction histidine kinase